MAPCLPLGSCRPARQLAAESHELTASSLWLQCGARQHPPLLLSLCASADGAAGLEASLQLGAGGGEDAPSDGGPDSAAALDPLGRAVVAALAQLGVTAGSDALWKPLNHQVRCGCRRRRARCPAAGGGFGMRVAGSARAKHLCLDTLLDWRTLAMSVAPLPPTPPARLLPRRLTAGAHDDPLPGATHPPAGAGDGRSGGATTRAGR